MGEMTLGNTRVRLTLMLDKSEKKNKVLLTDMLSCFPTYLS